ncbi:EAL domain-containing protein [Alteromonas sp. CYL-A6]|uniref:EAL domain-containing protein n=1 Tax=Alteromonas nitratireducens TaxID=3390813 RepID=UPI0034B569E8
MWCVDCETIEDYFFETTYFWIFVPTVEAFGKLAVMCGEYGLEAYQASSHAIRITVQDRDISQFLTRLNGCLDGPEFGKTKITTTSTPDQPDIQSIGNITTAETMIRRFQARWLVTAIENDAFQSWFQPIVHANSTADNLNIFAHEALFRLYDESDNIMPPNLVFPLAEQSDLLYSLDLVARRSAVEHAARGRLKGKVFINFNPSSIYDPSYCLRSTASAIAEIGMRPQDIVFELTETHRASDINHLKGILTFYRNSGFGIALDDVGSGWSGLNLLEQLRPDYVKIDMELIRDIDTSPYKQNIVKHLIQIAHDNRSRVIAEGIETESEAQTLREMEADYLQGFYFGKPAPVTERMSGKADDDIARGMKPLSDAARQMGGVKE